MRGSGRVDPAESAGTARATARALFVSVPSILRWRRDVESGVDRVVQSKPPANKLPDLVAHLSRLMTLEPGDLIATGTPAGVGSMRDPKVWLRPGDHVEIRSPQLGILENTLT